MSLSPYERETIINYSYAGPEATIFTYDRALISRLDRYRKKNPEIELLREEKTGAREYRVPKSWISVRQPPALSADAAAKSRYNAGIARRTQAEMRAAAATQKGTTEPDSLPAEEGKNGSPISGV